MPEKQLGRIACLRGLLCCEMAALGAGGPVEAVPIHLAALAHTGHCPEAAL
jgi:hypothetical protein